MQRYVNPPGYPPGRAMLKRKGGVPGMVMAVLVMSMMLIAVKPVMAGSATTAHSTSQAKAPKHWPKHHPRDDTYMKRKWGVELIFVRTTSAGYMLEFRYKVLDARKSKMLFERQIKPVLTHVRTGAKLIVPTPAKTGALRNSNPPKTGKVYWMFFANPGKLVKAGDRINIDIGEFHANGLVVMQ